MDNNNWRPQPQGGAGEPAMESGDWRTQLQPDSRQRIVNKIMETLKRHLPFSGQEGLLELKKIAVRFEEKIYSAAPSQSDYLRKISLKMLTMETKSQNPIPNNPNGNRPTEPGTQMQPQVNNQVQASSIPLATNQSQPRQQLLPQNNIQNSMCISLNDQANYNEDGTLKMMTDAEEDEVMRLAAEHVRQVVKATEGIDIEPSRGRRIRGCGSDYEAPVRERRRSTSSGSTSAEISELQTQISQQDELITELRTEASQNAQILSQNAVMFRYFQDQLRILNLDAPPPPFDPTMPGPSS